uniref:Uncharacterized protein n=1 Tax=Cannabis sativa TaxID=3483 RepID=A0A803QZH3_CANSA
MKTQIGVPLFVLLIINSCYARTMNPRAVVQSFAVKSKIENSSNEVVLNDHDDRTVESSNGELGAADPDLNNHHSIPRPSFDGWNNNGQHGQSHLTPAQIHV